jgi:TPR repeat protein
MQNSGHMIMRLALCMSFAVAQLSTARIVAGNTSAVEDNSGLEHAITAVRLTLTNELNKVASIDTSSEGSNRVRDASPYSLFLKGMLAERNGKNDVALHDYKMAAEEECAEAQMRLGLLYMGGEFVDRDMVEALKWLHAADSHGFVLAHMVLLKLYRGGVGVQLDDPAAVEELSKGASEGNPFAQYMLGCLYAQDANPEKAVPWLKSAVAQGFPEAEALLGFLYVRGDAGLTKDSTTGLAMLEKSAKSGCSMGERLLAQVYLFGSGGVLTNRVAAFHWFTEAAERGDSIAMWRLGDMYATGNGACKLDDTVAVEWFEKAAKQGDADGQFKLAIAYERGCGVSNDISSAAFWYAKAAAQGHTEAVKALRRLKPATQNSEAKPAMAKSYETTKESGDRLLLDATINGKSAHFAFDTGSSHLMLFPSGAARLGLSFINTPGVQLASGDAPIGKTEECELNFYGHIHRISFPVLEIPKLMEEPGIDGLAGWRPLTNNIIMIDACHGIATCLTNIPDDVTNWIMCKLQTNSSPLGIEVPCHSGAPAILLVDTGSGGGVGLLSDQWRDWKLANTNQSFTLDATYSPSAGLVVTEVGWAKKLSIGSLMITDVPVMEANKTDVTRGSIGIHGTLGLAALKRLDFIVDGNRGIAYIRPKGTSPFAYKHNRIGAVFTPSDLQHDDLIAHVIEGSPAWQAGVRGGDVLLRIGDLDATRWRTDPAVLPMGRFWSRSPGTKVDLTLKRGSNVFKANVILRQILGPERYEDSSGEETGSSRKRRQKGHVSTFDK